MQSIIEIIADVDIHNALTETALTVIYYGETALRVNGTAETTGMKGTNENIYGIMASLKDAVSKCGITVEDIDLIRLNDAAPAMEARILKKIKAARRQ